MGSLMNHKAGAVTEDLPTLATLIRFLAGVNPLVDNEVRVLTEGFPTLAAFIGLFSSVKSLVPNQAFT